MENDLLDSCYDFSSTDWRLLEKVRARRRVPAIIIGVARLVYFLCRALFNSMRQARWSAIAESRGRAVFFIGTKNNEHALMPVVDKLLSSQSSVFGYHTYSGEANRLPEWLFYAVGIVFFHRFLGAYLFFANSYQRWAMRLRLDQYVVACGAPVVWGIYLKLGRPAVVIVANDHNVWTRSLVKAAKKLSVPTIFVPHAPTGENPPPLIFDYAFLDGEKQLKMYNFSSGVDVRVVGAVRYEEVVASGRNESSTADGIVVAFNKMDSLNFVEGVVAHISLSGFNPVYVRPHPGDVERFAAISNICVVHGCIFSEPSISFVNENYNAKYVLAGVSGIHVDALMSGMLPVSTDSWYSGDYYGYREHGFVALFSKLDDICLSACKRILLNSACVSDLNAHLLAPSKKPSQVIASLISSILEGEV